MDMATSLYRQVVNMNPPYDIEFNARINMAGVFDITSGNPDEIKRELEKIFYDGDLSWCDHLKNVLNDLVDSTSLHPHLPI